MLTFMIPWTVGLAVGFKVFRYVYFSSYYASTEHTWRTCIIRENHTYCKHYTAC
jgi:hypothetical protein